MNRGGGFDYMFIVKILAVGSLGAAGYYMLSGLPGAFMKTMGRYLNTVDNIANGVLTFLGNIYCDITKLGRESAKDWPWWAWAGMGLFLLYGVIAVLQRSGIMRNLVDRAFSKDSAKVYKDIYDDVEKKMKNFNDAREGEALPSEVVDELINVAVDAKMKEVMFDEQVAKGIALSSADKAMRAIVLETGRLFNAGDLEGLQARARENAADNEALEAAGEKSWTERLRDWWRGGEPVEKVAAK